MNSRNKILVALTIILAVGGLAAGFVLAQESSEEAPAASAAPASLMTRVAGILGIPEETLADAFEQARMEQLDAAVVAGRLTEEQAQAIKDRIQARRAVCAVLEEAIASGTLTGDQVALLREGNPHAGPGGQRFGPMAGRMSGFGERTCGRFGFVMQGPRGMMHGRGFWGNQP